MAAPAAPPKGRIVLDAESAVGFLRAQGIYRGSEAHVQTLDGGVSSTVVLVRTPGPAFVLKQPLAVFRSGVDWRVPTRRAEVEARTARLLARHLGPEAIAPLRAFDPVNEVLILEAVPDRFVNLKRALLAKMAPPEAAASVGALLAGVHRLRHALDDRGRLREDELFRAQRVVPYFEAAAALAPEVAPSLAELGRRFFVRDDFVHGDFSPKNLFVSPDGAEARLIDHEVATRGDAAFDVAFFLTHLVMKAVHLADHGPMRAFGARFLAHYTQGLGALVDDTAPAREARAMQYLGGLLLGRALGQSRPEYLDQRTRGEVGDIGRRILDDAPPTWDALWRGPAC